MPCLRRHSAPCDPAGCGGIAVRAAAGPVRDRWLAHIRALRGSDAAFHRLPLHVHDDRLLGGLDLVATLGAGRPIAERGLLAQADGGVVVVSGVERMGSLLAARLASACDTGEILLERDGVALRTPSRFLIVALDEGIGADEKPPAVLLERLAFQVSLEEVGLRDIEESALHGSAGRTGPQAVPCE